MRALAICDGEHYAPVVRDALAALPHEVVGLWLAGGTEKGGFVANSDGTFAVDFGKIKGAVTDLTHDLLTIEAQGDYAGAKKMLDQWGVVRPEMQRAIDGLKAVPTDIDPVKER